jgi:hypothetical protein
VRGAQIKLGGQKGNAVKRHFVWQINIILFLSIMLLAETSAVNGIVR